MSRTARTSIYYDPLLLKCVRHRYPDLNLSALVEVMLRHMLDERTPNLAEARPASPEALSAIEATVRTS